MIVIISIFALIVLLYKYVCYRQSHWKRLNVTSPSPTFLFGHYFKSITMQKSTTDIYEDLYRTYKDKERVVGIYQFLTPQLFVTDPNLVKDICVKNFSNFHDSSFTNIVNAELDPILARNPFFISGQQWKDKRTQITPALSPARIKAMFPLVDDICVRIVDYLMTRQSQAIEARDLCSRYTCDVVSNCIYGADAGSFAQERPKIRDMASSIIGNGFNFSFMVSIMAPGLAKFMKLPMVTKEVNNFFSDLMGQAIEQRQRLGINRKDYLDYLLQMQGKRKVSNLELTADAITFFIDGLDTSATGIAGILLELARNKDIQARLRQELEDVTGYDQLVDHEFLDFVFHEALRLHPPAAFTGRECTAPIELEVLNKEKKLQIQKGDPLLIPVYSIHRDERIYEEPNKFNPDRFAAGELKRYKDEGLYLTFGAGPRICLGMRFAALQSKVCVAAILKNFEIELDTKTKLPLVVDPKEFITYYKGGIWLRFKKLTT